MPPLEASSYQRQQNAATYLTPSPVIHLTKQEAQMMLATPNIPKPSVVFKGVLWKEPSK